VTPTELSWSTTWKTKTGADRALPVILGHEVSGVVSEVGPGVEDDLRVGAETYGLTDIRRRNMDFLNELKVDDIIDYETKRFDDVVNYVGIVLDSVGRETVDRSLRVLRSGGRLISIVEEPSSELVKEASEHGIFRPIFF
jgi:NADPH:quinone reductase-like Zn-dependent oxidoreductase